MILRSNGYRKGWARSVAVVAILVTIRPWILFVLIAFIGLLDYATGPNLSFGIVYLLPISMAAWWKPKRWIAAICLACAATWLIADLASHTLIAQPALHFFNALTRLGIFLVVGFTLHQARNFQLRQMDLFNYVVHDLRSPLTAFSTSMELLAETLDSDPEQRKYLGHCQTAVQRMHTLINSILDLARLEEGRMPVQLERIPVADAVHRAMQETSLFAQNQKVELHEEIESPDITARGDPVILHRILVNLLTNAIKVSRPGDRVRLKAERRIPAEIVFSVIDSGPGIPPEYITRVFDKFVQVQLRKSGVSTGTGLGLAFCRLAATAHRGRIWIENIAANGACVRLALPVANGA